MMAGAAALSDLVNYSIPIWVYIDVKHVQMVKQVDQPIVPALIVQVALTRIVIPLHLAQAAQGANMAFKKEGLLQKVLAKTAPQVNLHKWSVLQNVLCALLVLCA